MNEKIIAVYFRSLAGALLCAATICASRLSAQIQNVNGNPGKSVMLSDMPACFEQDAGHPFGFDDYTNWSLSADDYYSVRPVGKCTLPFASVADNGVGLTFFRLKSSPAPSTVSFSEDSGFMFLSPSSTLTSTTLSFYPTLGWDSMANIDAEMNSKRIARLCVKGFVHKSIKIGVRLVHETSYNSNDIADNEILSALMPVYLQACIAVSICRLPAKIVSFDLDHDGMLDISNWTTSEMQAIINECDDNSNNCDYMIYIVSNPNCYGVLGIMDFNQRHGFIHGGGGTTIAHELGHGQGLVHTYERNSSPPEKGIDRFNLMNPTYSQNMTKLRFAQWIQLHNNQPNQ